MRFEICVDLCGHQDDSAEGLLLTRGVVEPSSSSLGCCTARATRPGKRGSAVGGLDTATPCARVIENPCCSNLGVRLRVRVLPDELEGGG